MAEEKELQGMKGSSLYSYTPFSQARGAENLRGFASGMTPKLSEPQSIFSGSAQQSSQDFSRLQMPTTPNIPLGNTVPVFPDNYNRVMGERMRAPSSMVSGIREGNFSGFSPYSPTLPSMGGLTQTPSMAPTTDAITSFGNPMASRTEGITTPYGTASTTLNPEQQAFRFQARQQAEQTGAIPRTPEQQQALLAQMRTRGAAIGRDIAGFQENFFQAKREERKVAEAMKGTSGSDSYYRSQPSSIADIQRDAANYKAIGFDKMSGYVQDSIRGAPSSSAGTKPAFGSGASFGQGVYFNPAPYEPIPMPVVDRTGRRIGTTEDTRVKRVADDETRVNPFIPRELQG